MARLPIPGKDNGTWGNILNDYLSQSHNLDGTLKADSVSSVQIQDATVAETQLDTTIQAKLGTLDLLTPMRTDTTGAPRTVRTQDETYAAAGILNWVHDGPSANYLLHLTMGENVNAAAAAIGIGVDNRGYGIAIPNKKSGEGIRQRQYATIDSYTAYGYHGMQQSGLAPLMFLEQIADPDTVAAPLLVLNNQQITPGVGQKIASFRSAGAILGDIYADTGVFEWRKTIQTLGSKISASTTTNSVTGDRAELGGIAGSPMLRFYRYGGSSKHYPWRIASTNTSEVSIQAGALEALGTETYDTTYIKFNRPFTGGTQIGFFGATPVPRPTVGVAATDAASTETLVNNLRIALIELGLVEA